MTWLKGTGDEMKGEAAEEHLGLKSPSLQPTQLKSKQAKAECERETFV